MMITADGWGPKAEISGCWGRGGGACNSLKSALMNFSDLAAASSSELAKNHVKKKTRMDPENLRSPTACCIMPEGLRPTWPG